MSNLKEIRDRVIEEQKELSIRTEKLYDFLFSKEYDNLDIEMRRLLIEQHSYMKNYLRILNKRIALINRELKND